MADIQQWRRMIQPHAARARTPAVEHVGDDSDGMASPTTPKPGLKPKFSSYFTNHGGSALAVRAEASFTSLNGDLFAPRLPTWPPDEPFPSPNATSLIDSIMCRLMSNPYDGLDPRFNGMLMQIFECYRNASDEKVQLHVQLDDEITRRKALLQALQHSQKLWSEEREDYKSEVKRLELLLAKGKRGLAEVTFARQDSELRQKNDDRRSMLVDNGLETIFELLERTNRYDDKAWSSQRASLRTRQPSPSAQMRRLSQQLMSKKSMTYIHADLPFGTPPEAGPSTLAEASVLERRQGALKAGKRARTGPRRPSDVKKCFSPKTSCSNDTCSTFSCVSDLLPDETPDTNLIEIAGDDKSELVAMNRIANVLARRRNIDPSIIMPKLFELFAANGPRRDAPASRSMSVPVVGVAQLQTPQSTVMSKVVPPSSFTKHPSLMSKASGFFQKLRPQLNVDTSSSSGRRFSFDTGDDTVPTSSTLAFHTPAADKERVLRKSVSLMSLAEIARRATIEPTLSPVAPSPTTSAPVEPHRASKIPTPVYGPTFLARPRQERESSTSSLLTVIKVKESDCTRRDDSLSSTSYSSPSASSGNVTQQLSGRQPHDEAQFHTANLYGGSSNRLLANDFVLQGNAFAAAAAARAAGRTTGREAFSSQDYPVVPTSMPTTSHLRQREKGTTANNDQAPPSHLRQREKGTTANNDQASPSDYDLQHATSAAPCTRSTPSSMCNGNNNLSTLCASDKSETSKENVRPMGAPYHLEG